MTEKANPIDEICAFHMLKEVTVKDNKDANNFLYLLCLTLNKFLA